MSDTEERVKKIVGEQLGIKQEEIKLESSFVEDLGADSLDTVELVMALEEEFEAEIPDNEAEGITTVQLAIDYINKQSTAKPADKIDSTKAEFSEKQEVTTKPVENAASTDTVDSAKVESAKEEVTPVSIGHKEKEKVASLNDERTTNEGSPLAKFAPLILIVIAVLLILIWLISGSGEEKDDTVEKNAGTQTKSEQQAGTEEQQLSSQQQLDKLTQEAVNLQQQVAEGVDDLQQQVDKEVNGLQQEATEEVDNLQQKVDEGIDGLQQNGTQQQESGA